MLAATKITIGEIGVRQELDLLGLFMEDLIEAILFGETHRGFCTDDDPRTFHGTTAWARTLRGLRQNKRLLAKGWERYRLDNFETFVSPDKTFQICVTTGDKETGKYDPDQPSIKPKPKNPKGIMLQRAVTTNAWLFPELGVDAEVKRKRLEAIQKRATWILLIHRKDDLVYAELSLPSAFEAKNVKDWGHRIILDPLDVEPLFDVRDDSDDGTDEMDIPVERI
jgi:hypothetical protein